MKSILETELEMGSRLPETVIPDPRQGSSYSWQAQTGNLNASGISGRSSAVNTGRRFFSRKSFARENISAAALPNCSLAELIDLRMRALR
jgi:hypothetical protein